MWRRPRSATPSPTTRKPASEPLPGFKPSVPVVFCGLFPLDAAEYPQLRDSLAKLRLNDASFHFEPETSAALGFGFRCGFLGLLASGDHPGTAGAGIQSGADHHRTVGGLQGPHDQRRPHGDAQPGRHARPHAHRPYGRAVDPRHHHRAGGLSRADPEALRGAARHAGGAELCRHPRHADLQSAAERGGLRFLRPPEIGAAAAMPASTITSKATRPAIW